MEINKEYPNLDTLVWLFKTNQIDLAEETAKQAIDLLNAIGQEYSETAKTLN